MYSYSALEKSRKSEAAQPKRRVPAFKPLQAKEKDNGGLFGDTVHRRVMRGLSSDKQSSSPYLRGSSANAVQLKGVVQRANGRNAYDAGIGANWHVHHGEHVKYDGRNETRVNFAGRTAQQVLTELAQVIQNNNLGYTTVNNPHYNSCIRWINRYV